MRTDEGPVIRTAAILGLVVGVLVSVGLVALGVLERDDQVRSPSPTDRPGVTTASTSVDYARCFYDGGVGTRIAVGLRGRATGLLNVYAVALARPVRGVKFAVAGDVDGPGELAGVGPVGVWGAGDQDGGGPLYAADVVALRYSTPGAAARNGSLAAQVRERVAATAEANLARRCVTDETAPKLVTTTTTTTMATPP